MLAQQPLQAQFISEVLEYQPAPGQFINAAPWGLPSSARSIVGGIQGSLSLGAFGGYVVFRFEEAVENHPDNPFGVDFSLFGNPLPDWSEPAVVWVMADENQNGLADDQWLELAGSDYYFSTSLRKARVSYVNPGGLEARDVPWKTQDQEGFIRANGAHGQSYYPQSDSFAGIDPKELFREGSLILGAIDVDHPPLILSRERAFGYADNRPRGEPPYTLPDNPYTPLLEHSGGDAFDLDWAVDITGMHVALDSIHFVKVQTALLHEGGYLGELSAEITGAVDVPPAPGYAGSDELLVLADLPAVIAPGRHALEVFLFKGGIPQEVPDLFWTCGETWASVRDGMLEAEGEGTLHIQVEVAGRADLRSAIQVQVQASPLTASTPGERDRDQVIYPNPTGGQLWLRGVKEGPVALYDLQGRLLDVMEWQARGVPLSLENLPAGTYFLRVQRDRQKQTLRFIKR